MLGMPASRRGWAIAREARRPSHTRLKTHDHADRHQRSVRKLLHAAWQRAMLGPVCLPPMVEEFSQLPVRRNELEAIG